ncbi:inositol monophosphatase family protein [Natronohydrobacter thiooxidans]|uniref:inositol monophosphatase family protein n=1 Tax=Natronohydrobacter thiooxidans TaxID=87172 RepID=UPI0008FF4687|nr:3'(2'),5'-bisphosphate nucleotidase CysQ [Natronohydrobacter thiooxidans]
MPGRKDLALLTDAARAAGDIARRYFGAAPRIWDKGDGQGPVTEADLEIDTMLRARLMAARPGYGWLSEESAGDADRLTAPRSFIIDPIDGTRAFIDGQKGFAHALAVIEDGVPLAAVVYLPMLERCYGAALGHGTHLNGQPVQVSPRASIGGAQVLAAKPQLQPHQWPGGVPQVTRHFRPSLAWRMALVAEGQFDAMLTLRPTWHWDIAAGALLISEAGGVVTSGQGQGLRFDTAHPASDGVIAANPALHAALLAARTG